MSLLLLFTSSHCSFLFSSLAHYTLEQNKYINNNTDICKAYNDSRLSLGGLS